MGHPTIPYNGYTVYRRVLHFHHINKPFSNTGTRQLLKHTSNDFCAINPMPLHVVKERQDVLMSPVTKISNK